MASLRYRGSSRRTSSVNGTTVLAVLGVLAALFAVVVVIPMTNYYELKHRVVTICKAERTATDSGGEYRVYTDSGTFVLTDASNPFIGRWRTNTADVYAKLKEGKTYDITYYGWRFGPTSSMPNIWKLKLLPEAQQNPSACD